jgi:hypothetical protein
MKKISVHEEGLGSIINRYENEEFQNLETFNKLFYNCKLAGFDPNLTVTIGDYNKGRRAVTIGDTITLEHEFSLIDLTLGLTRQTPFLLTDNKTKEIIGRFYTYLAAAEHLDMAYTTFRNAIARSDYIVLELTHE